MEAALYYSQRIAISEHLLEHIREMRQSSKIAHPELRRAPATPNVVVAVVVMGGGNTDTPPSTMGWITVPLKTLLNVILVILDDFIPARTNQNHNSALPSVRRLFAECRRLEPLSLAGSDNHPPIIVFLLDDDREIAQADTINDGIFSHPR
ncbi:hypothetical protein IFR05_012143 [Cadophora sp. M221]|nr:hypothetical protein IFR05_012143 [Cadophora sp. M221]